MPILGYGVYQITDLAECEKEDSRAIGVSNFDPDRLVDPIIHTELLSAVNQVETHPFCQQREAGRIMKENKVRIESWAPFAVRRNNLFDNITLLSIGQKYGKSVAQVVLRWLFQRDQKSPSRNLYTRSGSLSSIRVKAAFSRIATL